MNRTDIFTTQRRLRYLQSELERLCGRLNFGHMPLAAEKLWTARQLMDEVFIQLQRRREQQNEEVKTTGNELKGIQ